MCNKSFHLQPVSCLNLSVVQFYRESLGSIWVMCIKAVSESLHLWTSTRSEKTIISCSLYMQS